MNVEELVRDSLRQQAAEEPSVGPGFADRVLAVRRRRRTRRIASIAAATAAVVAMAVAVPLLGSGKDDVRPSGVLDSKEVHAHPDQSPPRDLISAGNVALAAYYTAKTVKKTDDVGVAVRTYWLLDPETGRYRKTTKWSYVAVAPGMRTAAVLEQGLPARRIGLLDLATGRVERWIPVDHGVGGLAFSRDGRKLVATTYDENPDLRDKQKGPSDVIWIPRFHKPSRTGFVVLDVASGKGSWSSVPADRNINARQDFAFNRDGRLVYSAVVGGRDGMQQFYDLAGHEVAAPANEKHLRSDVAARLSPDGRLAAVGLTKERPDTSYSEIVDPRTGKRITLVRGAELLAWVDDKRLIAYERAPGPGEYRPMLVLVTIGSDTFVQLSGPHAPTTDFSRQDWQPVFAER
ncbi:WD40 repeat domain-containing protein [Streptomyces sp. NPDC001530]|uniref:WD40 repeat domain-containing protein n=1 Tax=Streptomyces sp. NPDC001530 TaxID=3364582 RepID=UPI003681D134